MKTDFWNIPLFFHILLRQVLSEVIDQDKCWLVATVVQLLLYTCIFQNNLKPWQF